MLVRSLMNNLFFRRYYELGHNDPKYLGSTGFLPALQSYICRWNNTCYNQSKTTDEFNEESSSVFKKYFILLSFCYLKDFGNK